MTDNSSNLRTVWTKGPDDCHCLHCGLTWDMHICDGKWSCPTRPTSLRYETDYTVLELAALLRTKDRHIARLEAEAERRAGETSVPSGLVAELRKLHADILECDEGRESPMMALVRRAADALEGAGETNGERCWRCDGSGRITIYDTATYIGQPCAPIGDEPCPACSVPPTDPDHAELLKKIPRVGAEFVAEIRYLSRWALERRVLIQKDWLGSYSQCLDGMGLKIGVESARDPRDIRRAVESREFAAAWHRLVQSIATILEVDSNGSLEEVGAAISDAIQRLRSPAETSGDCKWPGCACPLNTCRALTTSAKLTLRDFGYAPGNYSCRCFTCERDFVGDKRAIQCERCAIEKLARSSVKAVARTEPSP